MASACAGPLAAARLYPGPMPGRTRAIALAIVLLLAATIVGDGAIGGATTEHGRPTTAVLVRTGAASAHVLPDHRPGRERLPFLLALVFALVVATVVVRGWQPPFVRTATAWASARAPSRAPPRLAFVAS
jgi:hypothetical protein